MQSNAKQTETRETVTCDTFSLHVTPSALLSRQKL
jgi:hypothetical protein